MEESIRGGSFSFQSNITAEIAEGIKTLKNIESAEEALSLEGRISHLAKLLKKVDSSFESKTEAEELFKLCQKTLISREGQLTNKTLRNIHKLCLRMLNKMPSTSLQHTPEMFASQPKVHALLYQTLLKECLQQGTSKLVLSCPQSLVLKILKNPAEEAAFLTALKAIQEEKGFKKPLFCMKGENYTIPLSLLIDLPSSELPLKALLSNETYQLSESLKLPSYAFHALNKLSGTINSMYSGAFKEKGQKNLNLQELDPKILSSILDHLFISEPALTETILDNLLAANYLQIGTLVQAYVEILSNVLKEGTADKDEVLSIHSAAQQSHLEKLQQASEAQFAKMLKTANAEKLQELLSNPQTLPIQELELSSSQVQNKTIQLLGQIPSLKILRLSNCSQITDLSGLNNSSIKEVKLINCAALQSLFNFGNLTQLTALEIKMCQSLSQNAFVGIGQASTLQTLGMNKNPHVINLKELQNMGLNQLVINNCKIDITHFLALCSLTSLQILSLDRCICHGEFNSNQLGGLQPLNNLHVLSLEGIKGLPPKCVVALMQAGAPTLQKLNLSGVQIDSSCPPILGTMTSLQTLKLDRCTLAKPFNLSNTGKLPSLTSLSLDEAESLPPFFLIQAIEMGTASLKELLLAGCQVNSKVFDSIAKLQGLTTLNLAYCSDVKEGDLISLVNLNQLKNLTVPAKLDEAARVHLKALIEGLQQLQLLTMGR